MNFNSVPIFEIVRLIDLQPEGETGFCMLIDPVAKPSLVPLLEEELAVQIAGSLAVVDLKGKTVPYLVKKLRMASETVVLMHGFDDWNESLFSSLDVNRSGLETGSFLLFSVDFRTASRFLGNAPNLRSFLGANIFVIAADPCTMSAEEIADRLGQLRSHYNLSDVEVIERASNSDLPPDPHFIEWLVLLERSELAR